MKKILLSDTGLKIFSVVLAASLWFFVNYRGQSEMVVDVPVEFKNMPDGLELLKQNIKKVSLSISGHEGILKRLRPMDLRAAIDLSNARKGEAVYHFDSSSITVPRTIKVLRFDPTSIKASLDESVSKTVHVKPYVSGMPAKGYRIRSIEVKPSLIKIEGAKTEVGRIAVLWTDTIDITDFDADSTQSVRLNTNGRNIRAESSEVSVDIKIEKVRQ
jgi:YbbR domain-containing protein